MQTNTDDKSIPLVTVILPAFNEALVLEKNLNIVCDYLDSIGYESRWEVMIINDGSTDDTGKIAEAFARTRDNVVVYHHFRNFGVGQALKFGFNNSRGDYIITLDIDLSYSVDHIGRLLDKIKQTRAKVVLASPYMRGGSISNVPWLRRHLSIWANRFLSAIALEGLNTLTCMVRVFDGRFLRGLNLRAPGMDVMTEIIHKTFILRGKVEQIPAHLNWDTPASGTTPRRSSMRIFSH